MTAQAPSRHEAELAVAGSVAAAGDAKVDPNEAISFAWSSEGEATVVVGGMRLRFTKLANGAEIEVIETA